MPFATEPSSLKNFIQIFLGFHCIVLQIQYVNFPAKLHYLVSEHSWLTLVVTVLFVAKDLLPGRCHCQTCLSLKSETENKNPLGNITIISVLSFSL